MNEYTREHLRRNPVTPAKRARNERMWAMQAEVAESAGKVEDAARYRALIAASRRAGR